MIKIENVRDLPDRIRGGYFTIGNFDGVHARSPATDRPPASQGRCGGSPRRRDHVRPTIRVALLRPEKVPVPLVWPERAKSSFSSRRGPGRSASSGRSDWLLGAVGTRGFHFDRVIRTQLGIRMAWWRARTSRSGRDRQGDVNISSPTGASQENIDFEAVEPMLVDDQLVSSSRIRRCLDDGKGRGGRSRAARGALPIPNPGHRDSRCGAREGTGLPDSQPGGCRHADSARWRLRRSMPSLIEEEATSWPVACNIGPNPTFGEQTRKVEAHLIGYDGDLYGRRVEARFSSKGSALGPADSMGSRNFCIRSARMSSEPARSIETSIGEAASPSEGDCFDPGQFIQNRADRRM